MPPQMRSQSYIYGKNGHYAWDYIASKEIFVHWSSEELVYLYALVAESSPNWTVHMRVSRNIVQGWASVVRPSSLYNGCTNYHAGKGQHRKYY